MVEQNNVPVDWQLAAFISSSASEHCWHCLALKKNAHRTGLYYKIIIYKLNVIYRICFATCWNWFRTQCSPAFYLCGAASLHRVRGAPGPPMETNLWGKAVPQQYMCQRWLGCYTAASDCLALLFSPHSKWMIRMTGTQGHTFSVFVFAVLIPLLRDLGQSVSLLSTSNLKKKQ